MNLVFPAGLRGPVEPPTLGPLEPLYYSALTAPVRDLAWLVDFDADSVVINQVGVSSLGPAGLRGPTEFGSIERATLSTVRHRFASKPILTDELDSPALTPIEARVQPIRVERFLEQGPSGAYGATAVSASGDVTLSNEDGALDQLLGSTDVALEGRPIRVSVAAMPGDGGTPKLRDFSQVFSGVIDTLSWNRQQIVVRITDDRLKFAQPLQQEIYTGIGGIDGPATLAGVTRPLAFGQANNVSPILIDPLNLIYQFHDGEARAVDRVRDSGVELERYRDAENYEDLLSTPVVDPGSEEAQAGGFTVGHFIGAPKIGCFRLGGIAAGRVTADVRGYGSADGAFRFFEGGRTFTGGRGFSVSDAIVHARTAPQVAITILRMAGITNVNVSQFAQLDADIPRAVGLYLEAGQNRQVGDILAQLLASHGSFLWKAGDGVYQLRRLVPPGVAAVRIGEDQIVAGSLERLPLPWKQPWPRWKVRHDRNWSPMQDNELAGAVDIERRVFLKREASEVEVPDDTTAIVYQGRGAGVLDTALVHAEAARSQGATMRSFYSRGRAMYRLRVKGMGFRGDLGDTVRVQHPRLGLASGWHGVIVRVLEDGKAGETEVTLFG